MFHHVRHDQFLEGVHNCCHDMFFRGFVSHPSKKNAKIFSSKKIRATNLFMLAPMFVHVGLVPGRRLCD